MNVLKLIKISRYMPLKRRTRKQRGGNVDTRFFTSILSEASIKNILKLCTNPISSGEYGTVLRACEKIGDSCSTTCHSIKYVPSMTNNLTSRLQNKVLAHESYMMYLLNNAISTDSELPQHLELFTGSIIPKSGSPWLFVENINGFTLKSDITSEHSAAFVELFLQTVLVLMYIDQLLPGFVHGDLNSGNIFIVTRPDIHKQCVYTINVGEEEFEEKKIVFDGKYMIKLIDFGSSETDNFKWPQHPSMPSTHDGHIAGIWLLDVYMALESFYNAAETADKNTLRNLAIQIFGADLTATMDDNEFDIFQNINLLKDLPITKIELVKLIASTLEQSKQGP